MSVDSANSALQSLTSAGLLSPGSVGGLPGAGTLTAEASQLGDNIQPIDFSQQQSIMGQQGNTAATLDALSRNLAVQKALAAQVTDKESRQGKQSSGGDEGNQSSAGVSAIGQAGLEEQAQLQAAGLSNRTAMALGKLHLSMQQIQQQGLTSKAQLATNAADQQISLAQSGGALQVQGAAQKADAARVQLMQQYEQQQWNFWGKIASGLITAAGGVAGFLIGGPVGAAAGSALASGVSGGLTEGGYQAPAPAVGSSVANPAQAPYTTPVLNTPYTGSTDSGAATAGYTVLSDSLPVV